MFPMLFPSSAGLATDLLTRSSLACSTCFGDPNSPLVQGAVAGVLVLIAIVGFVLFGIAGHGVVWVRRSYAIAQQEEAEIEAMRQTAANDSQGLPQDS